MDPAVELTICRTMAEEMEAYLLSDHLFRQLIVRTPLGDLQPKMTLGAFLEHYQRLRRREMALSPAQRAKLSEIGETWATMKRRYEGRYAERLHHELRSHLDSWKWFIDDCLRQPTRCCDDYPTEARARARVALLIEEIGTGVDIKMDLSRLSALDERLRSMWEQGRFIWSDETPAAYPPDRYWFLYGHPSGGAECD